MSWTDDFSFYLEPIPSHFAPHGDSEHSEQISESIDAHLAGHWPDLEQAEAVILGLGTIGSDSDRSMLPADAVREKFYKLFRHQSSPRLADIGNLLSGQSPEDTFTAIKRVVGALALRKILLILIGGSHELTYANYAAYEALESPINLCVIDSKIDMGEYREELSEQNFLSKIIVHKPSYLFNMSLLGFQSYYNASDTVALLDKMYFDALRLGRLREDVRCAEPVLRQADIVSIDMACVRSGDAPGHGQPNGLSGDEICRITRYAGFSDTCSSLGIYNYLPEKDREGQTALLIAQMMWYALEGRSARVKEYPLMNKPGFYEYKVQLAQGSDQIIFYKSKTTEKWWMNVPYIVGENPDVIRPHLIPCNYSDYEIAASGEVPDLWWKTYRKLS